MIEAIQTAEAIAREVYAKTHTERRRAANIKKIQLIFPYVYSL
jgi:hypothetical protein